MTAAALRMSAIASRALQQLPHLQTWPRHFRRRALEMGAISRVYNFDSARCTLELGCGNAFASALIADGHKQVVATDLFRERVETHSISLSRARELIAGLGVKRCQVAAATGDSLPFAGGAFDLVFSLFVMEHIPDRSACLREIRRVLAPGGVTVHAVPGALWAVPAPLRFPLYLIRRVFSRLLPERRPPVDEHNATASHALADEHGGGTMTWSLFRQRYPAFPLPPPHGSYGSYLEELNAYRRSAWIALFEKNGFDVLTCAPLTILSPDVLLRAPEQLGKKLLAFDQWLAGKRGLRQFGQFFVVVATPKGQPCL